jgi:hypothetical protein
MTDIYFQTVLKYNKLNQKFFVNHVWSKSLQLNKQKLKRLKLLLLKGYSKH